MSTDTYNVVSSILGGLTLVALLFYTYYTFRLLQATRATATSTQQELGLMQEQLAMARATADSSRKELEIMQAQLMTSQEAITIQKESELRAARPLFMWRGGYTNQNDRRVEFQNLGGPIAIIETRARHCSFILSPQNFVDKGDQGMFMLGGCPLQGPVISVGIKYVTAMNEIRTTVFSIESGTISPRIDSDLSFDGMTKMAEPPQPVDLIN